MNDWTELREHRFEDRTVYISRSKWALRKWKVTVEFKVGGKSEKEIEDEKDAWGRFFIECRDALEAEEARHQ